MRTIANLPMLFLISMTIGFMCWSRPVGGGPREGRADLPADAVAEIDSPRGKEILGTGLGEFILIRGGEFMMGRNEGEHEDQRPEHRVELSSFYVGRTPVTNAQFVQFLNETNVPAKDYLYPKVTWATASVKLIDGDWKVSTGTENDAACGLNWNLAQRYCNWLSVKSTRKCRLPTEAEWEYVCRGKEGRKFPWGNRGSILDNDFDTRVWRWRTWQKTKPNLIPVGSFPKGATPEGVCDLVGYMDEMCSDWYDPKYYAESPRKNPQGPKEPVPIHGDHNRIARVKRGGLEHHYSTQGAVGFFRVSEFFGFLPSTFVPRGWSRGYVIQRPGLPKSPKNVCGRLGFRVIVELTDMESCQNETSRGK